MQGPILLVAFVLLPPRLRRLNTRTKTSKSRDYGIYSLQRCGFASPFRLIDHPRCTILTFCFQCILMWKRHCIACSSATASTALEPHLLAPRAQAARSALSSPNPAILAHTQLALPPTMYLHITLAPMSVPLPEES